MSKRAFEASEKHLKKAKLENVDEESQSYGRSEREIFEFWRDQNKLEPVHIVNCSYYTFENYDNFAIPTFLDKFDHACHFKFRNYMLISILNPMQKEILEKWHWFFSKDTGCVISLNAPAGTGKSFLTRIFLLTMNEHVTFSTFRHDLINEIRLANTNHRFVTHAGLFTSMTKKSMFDDSFKYKRNSIFTLLSCFSLILCNAEGKNIIIDECTILDPWKIACLILLAKKTGFHIVFCGDKLQMHSIHKCTNFNASNFELIEPFADYSAKLTKQMRQKDLLFYEKLDNIRSFIGEEERENFLFSYNVFLSFRDKFYAKREFVNTVFLAYTHMELKKYMNEKIAYFRKKELPFEIVPYYVQGQKATVKTVENPHLKFPSVLYLFPGEYYHYTVDQMTEKKRVLRSVVKFIETETSKQGEKIFHFQDDSKRNIPIFMLEEMNHYHMSLEQKQKLIEHSGLESKSSTKIFGLPVKTLSARTFHSVQGLTFPTDVKIEIEMKKSTSNAVYVGLTRAQNEECVYKINTDYLKSFEFTYKKNDGNLYILKDENIPQDINTFVDEEDIFNLSRGKKYRMDRFVKEASKKQFLDLIQFMVGVDFELFNMNQIFNSILNDQLFSDQFNHLYYKNLLKFYVKQVNEGNSNKLNDFQTILLDSVLWDD